MLRVLILLTLTTPLISACSAPSAEPVIEVRSRPIQRPPLVLPPTTPYSALPIEWIVITPENFEQKLQQLKNSNEEYVFFALSTTGYENLSVNMANLLRFIREQNAIIVAYKSYYETTDGIIASHNSAK
jgi:hypothetical protein